MTWRTGQDEFTRAIGPHVLRSRQLVREHGDQVCAIGGHDIYRFARHCAGRGGKEGP